MHFTAALRAGAASLGSSCGTSACVESWRRPQVLCRSTNGGQTLEHYSLHCFLRYPLLWLSFFEDLEIADLRRLSNTSARACCCYRAEGQLGFSVHAPTSSRLNACRSARIRPSGGNYRDCVRVCARVLMSRRVVVRISGSDWDWLCSSE